MSFECHFTLWGRMSIVIHLSLNDHVKPWILPVLYPSTSFLNPQWFSPCYLCSRVFLPVWNTPKLLILWCFLFQTFSSFILWKRQKDKSERYAFYHNPEKEKVIHSEMKGVFFLFSFLLSFNFLNSFFLFSLPSFPLKRM